jgi:hypothetical protein
MHAKDSILLLDKAYSYSYSEGNYARKTNRKDYSGSLSLSPSLSLLVSLRHLGC